MRITEERMLIRLNVISIISILLTTAMIQIFDYQANKYNQNLAIKLLSAFQIHQVRTDHKLNSEFYSLYKALNLNVTTNSESVFNYADLEVKKLFSEVKNGSITNEEFFVQYIKYSKQKSKTLYLQYNSILEELIRDKPPKWLWMRNFILVPIQFIGIFLLLWGYWRLLKMISEKTMIKSKHQK